MCATVEDKCLRVLGMYNFGQRQDYVARHKRICGDLFKPTIDRAADAYAKIRAKGFDPCSKQTSMKYFEDNDDLYRSVFSIGKFDPSIGTGCSFLEAL